MARQRVPEGPPPAPAVQRLRLRYAKRGRLRFSSTRDFQRALERALRRAQVPMAYSGGFHPHPKISYANAAPTGTASEAEYFEISVTAAVDPAKLAQALDEALPDGLDILAAVEAPPGALADLLQAGDWVISLPGDEAAETAAALGAFLDREQVEVTRMTKSGARTFDVRSAVLAADLLDPERWPEPARREVHEGGRMAVRVALRHTTPAVRPDDLVSAVRTAATEADLPPGGWAGNPLMVRLAQGPLAADGTTVSDPLVSPAPV